MAAGSRWALVTGAAGGIGSAVCERLVDRDGLAVVGVDAAPRGSVRWEALECDLVDEATREPLFDDLLAARGAPALWASCAGRYERASIVAHDAGSYRRTMEDNFGHVFWLARRLVPAMAGAGGGRLVLLSSQAGASGGADPVYAAAKAAVTALGKSIAREHAGAGVLCNVLSPGPTDTPMAEAMGARRADYEAAMPIGRLASAAEVAEVACALLSLEGGSMTGATVDVDGGLLRR